MTEKTMLEQIRLLAQAAVNADDDQEQFSNLMRIIELTETANPPFAVGEYRAYKDRIYKITEDHDTYICCVELIDGVLVSQSGSYKTGEFYHGAAPAAAEQIAEFKRAEQFAKHGRKLDEFRVGDLIERDGELNILGNISMKEYGDVVVDGSEFTLGTLAGRYTLIQTAEELQEVGER